MRIIFNLPFVDTLADLLVKSEFKNFDQIKDEDVDDPDTLRMIHEAHRGGSGGRPSGDWVARVLPIAPKKAVEGKSRGGSRWLYYRDPAHKGTKGDIANIGKLINDYVSSNRPYALQINDDFKSGRNPLADVKVPGEEKFVRGSPEHLSQALMQYANARHGTNFPAAHFRHGLHTHRALAARAEEVAAGSHALTLPHKHPLIAKLYNKVFAAQGRKISFTPEEEKEFLGGLPEYKYGGIDKRADGVRPAINPVDRPLSYLVHTGNWPHVVQDGNGKKTNYFGEKLPGHVKRPPNFSGEKLKWAQTQLAREHHKHITRALQNMISGFEGARGEHVPGLMEALPASQFSRYVEDKGSKIKQKDGPEGATTSEEGVGLFPSPSQIAKIGSKDFDTAAAHGLPSSYLDLYEALMKHAREHDGTGAIHKKLMTTSAGEMVSNILDRVRAEEARPSTAVDEEGEETNVAEDAAAAQAHREAEDIANDPAARDKMTPSAFTHPDTMLAMRQATGDLQHLLHVNKHDPKSYLPYLALLADKGLIEDAVQTSRDVTPPPKAPVGRVLTPSTQKGDPIEINRVNRKLAEVSKQITDLASLRGSAQPKSEKVPSNHLVVKDIHGKTHYAPPSPWRRVAPTAKGASRPLFVSKNHKGDEVTIDGDEMTRIEDFKAHHGHVRDAHEAEKNSKIDARRAGLEEAAAIKKQFEGEKEALGEKHKNELAKKTAEIEPTYEPFDQQIKAAKEAHLNEITPLKEAAAKKVREFAEAKKKSRAPAAEELKKIKSANGTTQQVNEARDRLSALENAHEEEVRALAAKEAEGIGKVSQKHEAKISELMSAREKHHASKQAELQALRDSHKAAADELDKKHDDEFSKISSTIPSDETDAEKHIREHNEKEREKPVSERNLKTLDEHLFNEALDRFHKIKNPTTGELAYQPHTPPELGSKGASLPADLDQKLSELRAQHDVLKQHKASLVQNVPAEERALRPAQGKKQKVITAKDYSDYGPEDKGMINMGTSEHPVMVPEEEMTPPEKKLAEYTGKDVQLTAAKKLLARLSPSRSAKYSPSEIAAFQKKQKELASLLSLGDPKERARDKATADSLMEHGNKYIEERLAALKGLNLPAEEEEKQAAAIKDHVDQTYHNNARYILNRLKNTETDEQRAAIQKEHDALSEKISSRNEGLSKRERVINALHDHLVEKDLRRIIEGNATTVGEKSRYYEEQGGVRDALTGLKGTPQVPIKLPSRGPKDLVEFNTIKDYKDRYGAANYSVPREIYERAVARFEKEYGNGRKLERRAGSGLPILPEHMETATKTADKVTETAKDELRRMKIDPDTMRPEDLEEEQPLVDEKGERLNETEEERDLAHRMLRAAGVIKDEPEPFKDDSVDKHDKIHRQVSHVFNNVILPHLAHYHHPGSDDKARMNRAAFVELHKERTPEEEREHRVRSAAAAGGGKSVDEAHASVNPHLYPAQRAGEWLDTANQHYAEAVRSAHNHVKDAKQHGAPVDPDEAKHGYPFNIMEGLQLFRNSHASGGTKAPYDLFKPLEVGDDPHPSHVLVDPPPSSSNHEAHELHPHEFHGHAARFKNDPANLGHYKAAVEKDAAGWHDLHNKIATRRDQLLSDIHDQMGAVDPEQFKKYLADPYSIPNASGKRIGLILKYRRLAEGAQHVDAQAHKASNLGLHRRLLYEAKKAGKNVSPEILHAAHKAKLAHDSDLESQKEKFLPEAKKGQARSAAESHKEGLAKMKTIFENSGLKGPPQEETSENDTPAHAESHAEDAADEHREIKTTHLGNKIDFEAIRRNWHGRPHPHGLHAPEEAHVEAAKSAPPKAEAPKVEASKVEAPKAEAPKAPAIDFNKIKSAWSGGGSPAVAAPAGAPQKAEATKAETPKAEAPKVEAPKIEAPKAPAKFDWNNLRALGSMVPNPHGFDDVKKIKKAMIDNLQKSFVFSDLFKGKKKKGKKNNTPAPKPTAKAGPHSDINKRRASYADVVKRDPLHWSHSAEADGDRFGPYKVYHNADGAEIHFDGHGQSRKLKTVKDPSPENIHQEVREQMAGMHEASSRLAAQFAKHVAEQKKGQPFDLNEVANSFVASNRGLAMRQHHVANMIATMMHGANGIGGYKLAAAPTPNQMVLRTITQPSAPPPPPEDMTPPQAADKAPTPAAAPPAAAPNQQPPAPPKATADITPGSNPEMRVRADPAPAEGPRRIRVDPKQLPQHIRNILGTARAQVIESMAKQENAAAASVPEAGPAATPAPAAPAPAPAAPAPAATTTPELAEDDDDEDDEIEGELPQEGTGHDTTHPSELHPHHMSFADFDRHLSDKANGSKLRELVAKTGLHEKIDNTHPDVIQHHGAVEAAKARLEGLGFTFDGEKLKGTPDIHAPGVYPAIQQMSAALEDRMKARRKAVHKELVRNAILSGDDSVPDDVLKEHGLHRLVQFDLGDEFKQDEPTPAAATVAQPRSTGAIDAHMAARLRPTQPPIPRSVAQAAAAGTGAGATPHGVDFTQLQTPNKHVDTSHGIYRHNPGPDQKPNLTYHERRPDGSYGPPQKIDVQSNGHAFSVADSALEHHKAKMQAPAASPTPAAPTTAPAAPAQVAAPAAPKNKGLMAKIAGWFGKGGIDRGFTIDTRRVRSIDNLIKADEMLKDGRNGGLKKFDKKTVTASGQIKHDYPRVGEVGKKSSTPRPDQGEADPEDFAKHHRVTVGVLQEIARKAKDETTFIKTVRSSSAASLKKQGISDAYLSSLYRALAKRAATA